MPSKLCTRVIFLSCCIVLLLTAAASAAEGKVRLFILSGQSNMAGLPPEISFTPTVKEAFADDEVIVVKDAVGGQPIRRWYKQWKPANGPAPEKTGELYDKPGYAELGKRFAEKTIALLKKP